MAKSNTLARNITVPKSVTECYVRFAMVRAMKLVIPVVIGVLLVVMRAVAQVVTVAVGVKNRDEETCLYNFQLYDLLVQILAFGLSPAVDFKEHLEKASSSQRPQQYLPDEDGWSVLVRWCLRPKSVLPTGRNQQAEKGELALRPTWKKWGVNRCFYLYQQQCAIGLRKVETQMSFTLAPDRSQGPCSQLYLEQESF